jgi:putative nucleotidyltransferase with HDIG domain
MIDPHVLATDARALPPISTAAQDLMRLLRVVNTSADTIEQTMLRDASLTANVLRIANSPVFGLRRQVRSPGHAVTLLGHTRVRDLVVTASLQSTLPSAFPGYGITAAEFQRHSIAVAFLAERIGNHSLPGREAPWFVAGLLHDIGKLLLCRHLAERAKDLNAQLSHQSTLVSAEHALFGTDHTEVANVIGRAWQLPAEIIAAATGHHTPNDHAKSPHAYLIDVVHAANCAAHAMGYGADVAGLARALDAQVFQRLGLKPSVIEYLASEFLDPLKETLRVINSEVPTP